MGLTPGQDGPIGESKTKGKGANLEKQIRESAGATLCSGAAQRILIG